MIKASKQHKAEFLKILCPAFLHNKSINLVVSHPSNIPSLMSYTFDKTLINGEAYISSDHTSCALITYPKRNRFSLSSVTLDLKLAFSTIQLHRVLKVLKREVRIKKYQPKQDFVHLWFIGTTPTEQGKGYGSALLKEILSLDHIKDKPVYLETSVPNNIKWYQKLGFKTIKIINTGFDLYIMQKPPFI